VDAIEHDAQEDDDHAHEPGQMGRRLRRGMGVEMTVTRDLEMGDDVGQTGEGHRDQPDLHQQWEVGQFTKVFYDEHVLVIQPQAQPVNPLRQWVFVLG
jgi:hypothetical protein